MSIKTVRVVIFNDNQKLLGKLAKWVTGLADYHIGFTDGESFWDQGLLFRKRAWMPRPEENVTYFECPVKVTAKELDQIVFAGVERFCIDKKMSSLYGIRDYINFGLRKLGIGFNHNFTGVTCGGIVRDILASKGWLELGTITDLEPSPADIRNKFLSLGVKVIKQGKVD